MVLTILSVTPPNNSTNTFLDTPIKVEFNQPIDPFTVKNGLALYTIKKANFGDNPVVIDTNYRDYINLVDDYIYYDYNFTIDGNTVTIMPLARLTPDTTFYIIAFPGDLGERHVSKQTVRDPVYTRAASSNGTVNILSYFKGTNETTYQLLFNGDNTFDFLKNDIFQDTISYEKNIEIRLDKILISVSDSFEMNDSVRIDCVPTEGVTELYQTTFTTSKYTAVEPVSQTIDENYVPLTLISTSPKNLSVNNQRCNPITLTFSRDLDPNQDILNNIEITKRDYVTGLTSNITYYYKIMGNMIRLYLMGVEH